jgi:hypothetical protein
MSRRVIGGLGGKLLLAAQFLKQKKELLLLKTQQINGILQVRTPLSVSLKQGTKNIMQKRGNQFNYVGALLKP